MGNPAASSGCVRFGVFEADLGAGQLRKHGLKIKLQDQPFQILALLLERPGELLTREELREKLWPGDTFVDFDHGLNNAINRLREALGDAADTPRFIETLPRRGYRFLAAVETLSSAAAETAKPGGLPRMWFVAGALAGAAVIVLALNPGHVRSRLLGRPAPANIHSLAVLPLQNLSGDAAQDYFAEGVTDELTTNLAKISSLRVVSRTSTMQYAGHRQPPLPQIAQELNVDAVIEGSVVRSGSKVRITAQLIDARRDTHLWAQSYERELGEILEVQDAVALDIASQVKASLSPEERESLAVRRSIKPDAYEAYLRGRNELGRQTQDAIKNSVQYFQQAIDLDPFYASAYAGLADSMSLLANYGVLPPREAFPRAEAAARKSLDLDPSLAEAHASLALAQHHYDWDWAGAEAEYKRALQLAPGYAMAHLRYAELLSNAGRHEEAIREITRARELDPLSLTIANNLGRVLYYARRYDEAIRGMQKLVTLDPNRIYAHVYLGMAYEQKEMYPQAIAEFQRVTELSGGRPGPGLAHVYARTGQVREAKRILADLEKPSPEGMQDWFFIASVYVALGDRDQAFAWLEKAYVNLDFFMTYLKVYPNMDPLRSDPRFSNLLQRLRIAQ